MLANDPVMKRGIEAGSLQTSEDSVDSLLRMDHEPGSSLDLATILCDALATAKTNVRADGGFILLLDDGGWPSHWFVLSGDKGGFASLGHARTLVDRGIVSCVIRNHQAELVLRALQVDEHSLHELRQRNRYFPLSRHGLI